ncbi:MAG: hypothetical protein WKF47_06720 [Geodermatophilaceae bacterium]
MSAAEGFAVTLVDVDEPTLDRLVDAAIIDAAADEVTASVTTGPEWSPARIAWLRELHRSCRQGLNGPAGQATWAILAEDQIVGAVRLKRTVVPGILETGIWVTRRARGQGWAAPQQLPSCARQSAWVPRGCVRTRPRTTRRPSASCAASGSPWCLAKTVPTSRRC